MPNPVETKFKEALAPWLGDDEIVAQQIDEQHGDRTIVTKRDGCYSAYRAFIIGIGSDGANVAVSADLQDVSADEMIGYLLGNGDD